MQIQRRLQHTWHAHKCSRVECAIEWWFIPLTESCNPYRILYQGWWINHRVKCVLSSLPFLPCTQPQPPSLPMSWSWRLNHHQCQWRCHLSSPPPPPPQCLSALMESRCKGRGRKPHYVCLLCFHGGWLHQVCQLKDPSAGRKDTMVWKDTEKLKGFGRDIKKKKKPGCHSNGKVGWILETTRKNWSKLLKIIPMAFS